MKPYQVHQITEQDSSLNIPDRMTFPVGGFVKIPATQADGQLGGSAGGNIGLPPAVSARLKGLGQGPGILDAIKNFSASIKPAPTISGYGGGNYIPGVSDAKRIISQSQKPNLTVAEQQTANQFAQMAQSRASNQEDYKAHANVVSSYLAKGQMPPSLYDHEIKALGYSYDDLTQAGYVPRKVDEKVQWVYNASLDQSNAPPPPQNHGLARLANGNLARRPYNGPRQRVQGETFNSTGAFLDFNAAVG